MPKKEYIVNGSIGAFCSRLSEDAEFLRIYPNDHDLFNEEIVDFRVYHIQGSTVELGVAKERIFITIVHGEKTKIEEVKSKLEEITHLEFKLKESE